MIENMISVIIPVYNSEKYLDICLESVLGQRNAEIEILLIDDASSDGSPDICLEYEHKYHNVRYFRNEHKGVSEARNAEISFAEGEYL